MSDLRQSRNRLRGELCAQLAVGAGRRLQGRVWRWLKFTIRDAIQRIKGSRSSSATVGEKAGYSQGSAVSAKHIAG